MGITIKLEIKTTIRYKLLIKALVLASKLRLMTNKQIESILNKNKNKLFKFKAGKGEWQTLKPTKDFVFNEV